MFTDWRGTEIKIGSRIVYPGRVSSSVWMTESEVVGFVPWADDDWRLRPYAIDRHPPETRFNLRAKNVQTTGYAKPTGRTVIIKRTDRVTVVEDELTMTEALHLGKVVRTSPKYICGSRSPETGTLCELEPGHAKTTAHIGHTHPGRSAWA